MKKIFIVFTTLLMAITAKAWEVGDFYNLDGIPSIVVWVDSSGEHGLRMTPAASNSIKSEDDNLIYKSDKKNIDKEEKLLKQGKEIKKTFATQVELSKKNWKHHDKFEEVVTWQNKHIFDRHNTNNSIDISPLILQNCEYGEINMKSVQQFCDENNLDIQCYFPSFYWATTIGNNWFIPGAHEAELISKLYTDNFGEYESAEIANKKIKKVRDKIGSYLFGFGETEVLQGPFGIMSNLLTSTLVAGDWVEGLEDKDKLIYIEQSTSDPKYESNNEKLQLYRGNESKVFLSLCFMQKRVLTEHSKGLFLHMNIYLRYPNADYTKNDGVTKCAVSYF